MRTAPGAYTFFPLSGRRALLANQTLVRMRRLRQTVLSLIALVYNLSFFRCTLPQRLCGEIFI